MKTDTTLKVNGTTTSEDDAVADTFVDLLKTVQQKPIDDNFDVDFRLKV